MRGLDSIEKHSKMGRPESIVVELQNVRRVHANLEGIHFQHGGSGGWAWRQSDFYMNGHRPTQTHTDRWCWKLKAEGSKARFAADHEYAKIDSCLELWAFSPPKKRRIFDLELLSLSPLPKISQRSLRALRWIFRFKLFYLFSYINCPCVSVCVCG